MITVAWYDHNTSCNREGKLVQIARGKLDNKDDDVAYVLTVALPNDLGHYYLHGGVAKKITIIKQVPLDRLIVKGFDVPLIG